MYKGFYPLSEGSPTAEHHTTGRAPLEHHGKWLGVPATTMLTGGGDSDNITLPTALTESLEDANRTPEQ